MSFLYHFRCVHMEMVMIESQNVKYCDSRNKSVSELAGCLTEDTKAQMQCLKIFSDTKQWLVLYFFLLLGNTAQIL